MHNTYDVFFGQPVDFKERQKLFKNEYHVKSAKVLGHLGHLSVEVQRVSVMLCFCYH